MFFCVINTTFVYEDIRQIKEIVSRLKVECIKINLSSAPAAHQKHLLLFLPSLSILIVICEGKVDIFGLNQQKQQQQT